MLHYIDLPAGLLFIFSFQVQPPDYGADNYLQLEKVVHSSDIGDKFTEPPYPQYLHAGEVKGTWDTLKRFSAYCFVLFCAPCHRNCYQPTGTLSFQSQYM